jgi:DMSO/TMAO reductase YedYZ molybdopterin-dependent catalytic subunit
MSNQQVTLAGPARPPMEPASGLRRIKLRPHEMSDTITASEDVFVLAHLGVPRIDPAQWRLSIDGLVGEARTLGLDDLKARPKSIVEAVHQCCGNPLEPNLPTRRVVNVRWGGVDLAALLDELGVDPRARFLWSYGLDGGAFAGTDCDWYVKDMPLERLAAGGRAWFSRTARRARLLRYQQRQMGVAAACRVAPRPHAVHDLALQRRGRRT